MEQNNKDNRPKTSDNVRYKPLRLPFQSNGKVDPGEWIYVHRVGLLVTIMLYLVAAIIFMSYKIMLSPAQVLANTIVIDLEQPIPQDIEEQQKLEKSANDLSSYENVRNQLSNENAKSEGGAGTRSAASSTLSDAEAEAQRINDMLNKGRQTYEQGLAQAHALSGKSNRPKSSSSNKNQASQQNKGKGTAGERGRAAGNVVVSYDLANRVDTYLHIPAYECQGGGKIVVEVMVSRNGRVVSASVTQMSDGADGCVEEMAIKAAKKSSFNVSSSAPDKQRGFITYIFLPQF